MDHSPAVRVPHHPVADLIVKRWSPRAFTGEAIPEDTLHSLFEAVRWAPSAGNSQPWRLIFARRETPAFETILGVLNPSNRIWAERASALIIIVPKARSPPPGGEPTSLPTHSFDAGAAWAHLALQAEHLGWSAHAMAGSDRD